MRSYIKLFLLFLFMSSSILAQEKEIEIAKSELFGKWQLKEVINSETAKLCPTGENFTFVFNENTLTVYEVDDEGCQNGIANEYDYKLNGEYLSIWDGNIQYKIVKLTENELTLDYEGEKEVYEKIK